MAQNKKSSRGRQANSSKKTSSTKDKKFHTKDKNYRINPNSIKNFKKKPAKQEEKKKSTGIRLNKYIANAGICSRREADVFIGSGSATVNGKVIIEMGYKVQPDDIVRFDGQLLTPEKNNIFY